MSHTPITAEQAFFEAEKILAPGNAAVFDEITRDIRMFSAHGLHNMVLDYAISDVIVKSLENMGFTVIMFITPRGHINTCIHWVRHTEVIPMVKSGS